MFELTDYILNAIDKAITGAAVSPILTSPRGTPCGDCQGHCKNSCRGECSGSCQGSCTRSCQGHSR